MRTAMEASTSHGHGSNWDATTSLDLNHPTLVMLEKCKTRRQFKEILAHMVRLHLTEQTFPMSRLLYFSAISHRENLDFSLALFHHFEFQPNLFMFNTMIAALASIHKRRCFCLYKRMLKSAVSPDKHTLNHLLKACRCLTEVQQVHQHGVISGFSSYSYLQNSLVKIYMENGALALGRKVFDKMSQRDVVSWNSLIWGYVKAGCGREGLKLFQDMCSEGVVPDEFTMVGALGACAKIGVFRSGRSIHTRIIKMGGVSGHCILGNALLDMYVKCKELDYARKVFDVLAVGRDAVSWNILLSGYAKFGKLPMAKRLFDEMPIRDSVTWNSIIDGYAQKGDMVAVVNLFEEMQSHKVKPDGRTIMSLASVIGMTGNLDKGKWVHGLVAEARIKMDAFLGSALVDMYSKCGSVEKALSVFEEVQERDVSVWSAMISGLALHGHGTRALELFRIMQAKEIQPNHVTFTGVLSACSHCGMVEEGLTIFHSMKQIYGIEPCAEHYGCVIDLLGRAGKLMEAKDLIERMSIKPTRSIWGAMLNACRVHQNVEIAEIASRELLKIEPEEDGGYIILSNIYASVGRWRDADIVRQTMENRGVRKVAGQSAVVVNGVFHEFVSADKAHPRWSEIYSLIHNMNNEMKVLNNFT
ncbi:Pentatricopeptide repeat-containing protein [Nymphaea thermarum]|nr:Pentatricopeptide repeat-containing protein [Nymphaea thermarum]